MAKGGRKKKRRIYRKVGQEGDARKEVYHRVGKKAV